MSAEIFDWLLRSTWALAVAAVLVMVLRPLWRRWLGAGAVLWLYLLLPAALLATSLPGPRVVLDAPATLVAEKPVPAGQPLPAARPASGPSMANGSSSISPAMQISLAKEPVSPAARFPQVDALTVALLAWAAGALALAGWLLQQQRRFRRRLGRLQRREANLWQASANDIGPVVIGLLRPRIIVPADFDLRYDAQQRALVLAHERVHLRRGDLPMNALACALRCLFWFNPLVHLAAAKLRLDQELACDAAVLAKNPRAGRAYATALLNTQLADLGLPVGCAWQSSHPLTWRISMLKKPLPGPARLMLGAGLAVLASSAGAAALWQQQPATIVTLPAISLATAVAPLPPLAVEGSLPALAPVAMSASSVPTRALAPVAPVAVSAAIPAAAPMQSIGGRQFVPDPAKLSLPPPPIPRADFEPVTRPQTSPVPGAVAESETGDYRAPQVRLAKPARLPLLADVPDGAVINDAMVMRVTIDARGEPTDVKVHASKLGRVYERNALAAVRRWQFEPAMRNGQPVSATVLVPMWFESEGDEFASVQAERLAHPVLGFNPDPQVIAGQ